MAKIQIDNKIPELSVGYKDGDGFGKVWNIATTYVFHTYDDIVFDQYNLILYGLYILIAIVTSCLVVYTIKCICLCNAVRKNQNEIMEKKLSSNKRKQE